MAEIIKRTTNKEFTGAITDALKKYAEAYKNALEEDYELLRKQAKPGDALPPKGNFIHDPEIKEDTANKLREIREKALEVVDKAYAETLADEMTAPDEDAIRVLQVLNMVGADVNRDLLKDVHDVYGSNYLVSRALRKIAHDNEMIGVVPENTVFDSTLDELERVRSVCNKISIFDAETTGDIDSYVSFQCADIEGHFSSGEE